MCTSRITGVAHSPLLRSLRLSPASSSFPLAHLARPARAFAKKGKGGGGKGARGVKAKPQDDGDAVVPAVLDWDHYEEQLLKALQHLEREFHALQSTRASAGMLDHLEVEVYGSRVGLRGAASVMVRSPSCLAVAPYDPETKAAIVRAIRESPLGLTAEEPGGGEVLVNLPAATRDHMEQVAKVARTHAEHSRTVMRHERHRMRESVKGAGLPQDEARAEERRVQDLHDKYVHDLEVLLREKEKQLMSV